MSRIFVTLICVLALAACGNNPADTTARGIDDNGQQAYAQICAVCHETGMLGAPIAGDDAYWKGRSTLWQAVLMEHAKQGYYDMPAKGGRTDVSDEQIDAATEYMLSITFPDLPKDQ